MTQIRTNLFWHPLNQKAKYFKGISNVGFDCSKKASFGTEHNAKNHKSLPSKIKKNLQKCQFSTKMSSYSPGLTAPPSPTTKDLLISNYIIIASILQKLWNFAEWVDIAYWWSCIGKGLLSTGHPVKKKIGSLVFLEPDWTNTLAVYLSPPRREAKHMWPS